MDAITRLRDVLHDHGFFEAAKAIETNQRDAERALLEWRDYPKCMDVYTKVVGKAGLQRGWDEHGPTTKSRSHA